MKIENSVLKPQILLVDFDNGVRTGIFSLETGEVLDYVVLESTCASNVASELLKRLIENNIDIRAGFVHKDYDMDILVDIGEWYIEEDEFASSSKEETIVRVWIKEIYNKDEK